MKPISFSVVGAAIKLLDQDTSSTSYRNNQVSSSATADTFGSWGQLVANVGANKHLIGIIVVPRHSTQGIGEIEIGEGASGVEVTIMRVISFVAVVSAVGLNTGLYFPVRRALTDSARLSARVKDNVASALDWHVEVVYATYI